MSWLCGAAGLLLCPALLGQTAPAPAGVDIPKPAAALDHLNRAPVLSPKQLQAASEAYLKGARALDHQDLGEAEVQFARAAKLNPQNRDYAVALAVVREHRLTDLVQEAAKARQKGDLDAADRALLQAREIDPDNAIVAQHFAPDGKLPPMQETPDASAAAAAARAQDASTLAGMVQLAPDGRKHSFHLREGAQELLADVCRAYGLRVRAVSAPATNGILRFDLDDVDWPTAWRTLQDLTHTFGVAAQPTEFLVAADTPDNRAAYQPLLEETLYMPGTSQADLTEYANMARNVFNLRVVNAISSEGSLVLRGDQASLQDVNATFADLVDGGSDVLLDLTLWEVDKSRINNVGAQLPSSVGVFPVAATAENLISSNQSLINQAIANNLITLTGNAYTDALTELEFLLASGTVSATQFTNLLGVLGHYGGLPLAGVFLGSTTTVNASLTSSDVRVLDNVQLRIGDKQEGQFRAGTRYPIETGIYSSSLPSSLTSAVAGLNINGTSVSSLLSQYLGSASASLPQVQYEDLGLTLKATPQVQRSGEVSVKLDLKIEALGSGSINTLPILNNRQLTSTVTIPRGATAMVASEVNTSEIRAITGLPYLSEIPGFQSTNKSVEKDSTELLITLTPHVVRNRDFHVASRRLLVARSSEASTQ